MNEVYISGKIVKLPQYVFSPETDYFHFLLQVTFFDSSDQIVINNFVVTTYNQNAKWAIHHLHLGDEILIKGMLNSIQIENTKPTVISASQIIIVQHALDNR